MLRFVATICGWMVLASCVMLSACAGSNHTALTPDPPQRTASPTDVAVEAEYSQRDLATVMSHTRRLDPGLRAASAVRRIHDISGSLPALTADIFWEADGNGTDRFTTNSVQERLQFQRYSDGQSWYLAASSQPGTLALYRLYNGSDNMDSTTAGEGGYQTLAVLGYPFASQTIGTSPMFRFRDPNRSNGDHATPPQAEYTPIQSLGYLQENSMGYGYSRYGQALTSLTTFSGGGVQASANAVAGGAIWSWIYNGTEYVANLAGQRYVTLGNQIQPAFFYPTAAGTENPTQAGDGACCSYNTSQYAEDVHGSPVASMAVTGGGTGISTRAIPLEFSPQTFGASPGNQAVLYNTMLLGEDIQLNFNGMGPVAQWTTSITMPNAVSGANMEIPTGYMQPLLSTFYTYDAQTDNLTQVHPPVQSNCTSNVGYPFPKAGQAFSGYGGVIISDPPGNNAQGVFALSTAVHGPAAYFALYDFASNNCSYEFTKWDVVTPTQSFPAGTSTYKTYVVTGTLAQVQQLMHSLYVYFTRTCTPLTGCPQVSTR